MESLLRLGNLLAHGRRHRTSLLGLGSGRSVPGRGGLPRRGLPGGTLWGTRLPGTARLGHRQSDAVELLECRDRAVGGGDKVQLALLQVSNHVLNFNHSPQSTATQAHTPSGRPTGPGLSRTRLYGEYSKEDRR